VSLIEIRDVSKSYGGLRPFRLQSLAVDRGEYIIIEGPDLRAAAVLTDLITGTTLPESGSVVVDGQATSDLSEQDQWLAFLDRFGIVNERVVLLDGLSVAANLAVPVTLDLDPMPEGIRRAVEALSTEIGLAPDLLDTPLERATPLSRLLVKLGRAIAHDPIILLVEHPTVELADERDARAAADALRRVAVARRLTTLIISSDTRTAVAPAFASGSGTTARRFAWRAATGDLREARGWRRWFS
jgi:ABC-type transporter Mla maintaining outer membrane lipid asymmetry ATPase subunit MlaF